MTRFYAALVLVFPALAAIGVGLAADADVGPPSLTVLERALNDYRRGWNAGLSPIQVIGLRQEYDGSYTVYVDLDPTERNPVVFENAGIRLIRLESNEWLMLGLGQGGKDSLIVRDTSR